MKIHNALNLTAGMLIAIGLVGCQPSIKDTSNANDDMKKASGTWTLVSGEVSGKPVEESVLKNAKLMMDGEKYTVDLGEMGVKKGTQKFDATKTPKQIDAQQTEGPNIGLNLGIYEFMANGDFRVCFGSGKERPTAFVTSPENGQFVHVWRRSK